MSFLVDGMFKQGSTPVLENALRYAHARNEVIANNIANAETPDYKARDLPMVEFQKALAKAIQSRKPDGTLAMPYSRILKSNSAGVVEYQPLAEDGLTARQDGNNVDLSREMGELSKNGLLFNTSIQLLRDRYQLILSAIQGRSM